MLISLYKQLAPHLKIRVHKRNMVCDFDTIWAIAAAIIVQLDTLYIIYSWWLITTNYFFDHIFILLYLNNASNSIPLDLVIHH